MSEPLDCGYLSLPPEIQAACEAGPPPSDRIRIEILADRLGYDAKVDYEADMAYIKVRDHDTVYRTDSTLEDRSIITDYDEDGNLLGVEVFLVQAAIGPDTVTALKRLLE